MPSRKILGKTGGGDWPREISSAGGVGGGGGGGASRSSDGGKGGADDESSLELFFDLCLLFFRLCEDFDVDGDSTEKNEIKKKKTMMKICSMTDEV